jgi:hypothetical protein
MFPDAQGYWSFGGIKTGGRFENGCLDTPGGKGGFQCRLRLICQAAI